MKLRFGLKSKVKNKKKETQNCVSFYTPSVSFADSSLEEGAFFIYSVFSKHRRVLVGDLISA